MIKHSSFSSSLVLPFPLLSSFASLLVLGVVMVFSSSYMYAQDWYGGLYYFFYCQLISLGLALVLLFLSRPFLFVG